MKKIIFLTMFFACYISAEEVFFECDFKSSNFEEIFYFNVGLDRENSSATIETNYMGSGRIYQAKPSFTSDELILTYNIGMSRDSTARIDRSTLKISQSAWHGNCKIIEKNNKF